MFNIKLYFSLPLSVLVYFLGDFDIMLSALFALVILDIITGFLCSVYKKTIKSDIFYKNGIRKIGLLFIIAIGNIIDNALLLGGALRSLTLGYYIATESISILENWGELGLPLPSKLKLTLDNLKADGETEK